MGAREKLAWEIYHFIFNGQQEKAYLLLAEYERSIHSDGASWMLNAVVGSLKSYPNAGGDKQVMTEVERIAKANKQ